jgi:hypothetical protein
MDRIQENILHITTPHRQKAADVDNISRACSFEYIKDISYLL